MTYALSGNSEPRQMYSANSFVAAKTTYLEKAAPKAKRGVHVLLLPNPQIQGADASQ